MCDWRVDFTPIVSMVASVLLAYFMGKRRGRRGRKEDR